MEEILVKTSNSKTRSVRTLKVKSKDTINKIRDEVVEELNLADQQDYMIFFNNEYKPLNSIEKLEDAKSAGTDNSKKCTLILTEGDSAKAFVMSGLSTIFNGEDIYGVFPLKGKISNVRRTKLEDLIKNEEIQSLITILGLRKREDNTYKSDIGSLRYGRVMIMSDPDYDGSHFKGLIINLIYMLWPSLLKCPNFLFHALTPIIKISNNSGIKQLFYFHQQYEAWKKDGCNDSSSWEITYYKGLSTNTPEEAVEYFQNIENYKKCFIWKNKDDQAIDIPFHPTKTGLRKEWIGDFEHENLETYIKEGTTNYAKFIHSELILYYIADIQRKIPSLADGLNKVQRKILFSLLQREDMKPEYIGILIGYVSERTCYRHNEVSIANAIIKMARHYVNSNNINLLLPLGHFGSSKLRGKDVAAYRYSRTQLNSITRYIFLKDDDMFLEYLKEGRELVEPYCYRPVIPMILVNGCATITVGWTSYIPKYHPSKIIENIRSWLRDRTTTPMIPLYNGFRGSISEYKSGKGVKSFLVKGKLQITGKDTFVIQEIPFTQWSIEDYKKFLTSLTIGDVGNTRRIKAFEEIKKEAGKITYFKVHLFAKENVEPLGDEDIEYLMEKFHLRGFISLKNMNLLDENMELKNYDSAEAILEEFSKNQLSFYEKKKKDKVAKLESDIKSLYNKMVFIELLNMKKDSPLTILMKKKEVLSIFKEKLSEKRGQIVHDYQEEDNYDDVYNFVKSMTIGTLFDDDDDDGLPKMKDEWQRMKDEWQRMREDIENLKRSTPETLWLKDIERFESTAKNLLPELYNQNNGDS